LAPGSSQTSSINELVNLAKNTSALSEALKNDFGGEVPVNANIVNGTLNVTMKRGSDRG